MVLRRVKKVSLEVLSDDRVIISGGALVGNLAWVPPAGLLTTIDGRKFIELRQADRSWASLVGVPLHNNGFVDDVIKYRTLACTAQLDGLIKERADVQHAGVSKMREARRQLVQHHEDKLPSTTLVPFPGAPSEHIEVKFEHDARKALTVLLAEDVMEFFVARVRASQGSGGRKRKRCKSERRTFKYEEVRWDEGREVPFVRYTDGDGMVRYRSCAPREIDSDVSDASGAEREAESDAVEWLHKFFTDNHHQSGQADDAAEVQADDAAEKDASPDASGGEEM